MEDPGSEMWLIALGEIACGSSVEDLEGDRT